MTTDKQNDLDWLAFCYAAGELDAAEAERFENRLIDDQPAREALARAVELTQTVAAAETQRSDYLVPARHVHADWNRRLSWMAVGGLASLLVALLWSGIVGPTWNTAQRKISAVSRYQLAMAWNQTRDEFAGVRDAALWVPHAETDDEVAFVGFTPDDETIADAPSWMMAALFTEPASLETNSNNPEP